MIFTPIKHFRTVEGVCPRGIPFFKKDPSLLSLVKIILSLLSKDSSLLSVKPFRKVEDVCPRGIPFFNNDQNEQLNQLIM